MAVAVAVAVAEMAEAEVTCKLCSDVSEQSHQKPPHKHWEYSAEQPHQKHQHRTARHSTAQHSTAQHSTAQHMPETGETKIAPESWQKREVWEEEGNGRRKGKGKGRETEVINTAAQRAFETSSVGGATDRSE